MARRKGAPKRPDPRKEAFEHGVDRLVGHGLFRDVSWVSRLEMPTLTADQGWARVDLGAGPTEDGWEEAVDHVLGQVLTLWRSRNPTPSPR